MESIDEEFERYYRLGYEITEPGRPTYHFDLERLYEYCKANPGSCDNILTRLCPPRKEVESSPYIRRFCGCFTEGLPGIPKFCDPLCRDSIKPKDYTECNPDLCVVTEPGSLLISICPHCRSRKCSPVFVAKDERSMRKLFNSGMDSISDLYPTYSCIQNGKKVRCPISARAKPNIWMWIVLISAGIIIFLVILLLILNGISPLLAVVFGVMLTLPFIAYFLAYIS